MRVLRIVHFCKVCGVFRRRDVRR